MKVRAEVAELLRAGHSARAIARQLHVDGKSVRAARDVLGVPVAKPGRKAAATPEELFWSRTHPTDDGHLLWTGGTTGGVPILRHGGRRTTAYRVSFRIQYGREPEGRVTPTCGRRLCVRHVEDRVIRERTEATYAAIFGPAA
jgi:hypothetical protein